jgi:ABC-type nickel/cobalt efflux system permease component RcnA
MMAPEGDVSETWAVLGVLGLGLVMGLRHATEADHIAAIGAMVSEHGGVRRALRTGVLWGTGHTISILAAGIFVLGMRMAISEQTSRLLEGGVALMIVTLGGAALSRALRGRTDAHRHTHTHGGRPHIHLHFHGPEEQHLPSDQGHIVPVGIKPLLVGVVHGLAGSAALTLLVLTRTPSAILGLGYLATFGFGSIGGMALMSALISLPFHATAGRPAVNRSVRIVASGLGLAFGLFYGAVLLWSSA